MRDAKMNNKRNSVADVAPVCRIVSMKYTQRTLAHWNTVLCGCCVFNCVNEKANVVLSKHETKVLVGQKTLKGWTPF